MANPLVTRIQTVKGPTSKSLLQTRRAAKGATGGGLGAIVGGLTGGPLGSVVGGGLGQFLGRLIGGPKPVNTVERVAQGEYDMTNPETQAVYDMLYDQWLHGPQSQDPQFVDGTGQLWADLEAWMHDYTVQAAQDPEFAQRDTTFAVNLKRIISYMYKEGRTDGGFAGARKMLDEALRRYQAGQRRAAPSGAGVVSKWQVDWSSPGYQPSMSRGGLQMQYTAGPNTMSSAVEALKGITGGTTSAGEMLARVGVNVATGGNTQAGNIVQGITQTLIESLATGATPGVPPAGASLTEAADLADAKAAEAQARAAEAMAQTATGAEAAKPNELLVQLKDKWMYIAGAAVTIGVLFLLFGGKKKKPRKR